MRKQLRPRVIKPGSRSAATLTLNPLINSDRSDCDECVSRIDALGWIDENGEPTDTYIGKINYEYEDDYYDGGYHYSGAGYIGDQYPSYDSAEGARPVAKVFGHLCPDCEYSWDWDWTRDPSVSPYANDPEFNAVDHVAWVYYPAGYSTQTEPLAWGVGTLSVTVTCQGQTTLLGPITLVMTPQNVI